VEALAVVIRVLEYECLTCVCGVLTQRKRVYLFVFCSVLQLQLSCAVSVSLPTDDGWHVYLLVA
jgi:hypothetical protein